MTTSQNVSSTSNINGALQNGVAQATTGAHNTIDKVSEAARPAVDRFAATAHHAVDKIAGVASHAAETLGVKGEQLKNVQQRLMEEARNYVHEKPITSLGIAVAAGFLLSRLISSK